MSSLTQYTALFRDQRALLEQGSTPLLNACRDEALAALELHGLPSRRTERYKYCNVEAALAPDYGLNLRRIPGQKSARDLYRCNVPGLGAALYFVVNDVVEPLQVHSGQPSGEAVVTSFCGADTALERLIGQYYHTAAGRAYDALTMLNTLFAQDGLLIYVPDGVRMEHPVQIVNVADSRYPLMSNRRVLVIAGRDSAATILFCDHAMGAQPSLTTQVVEVFAAENAALDLYSIEETGRKNTRFCNLYAEQQAHSRVAFTGVTLSCGLTRHLMDVRLQGIGAETVVNGAVITDGQQQADYNVLVEHAAPECSSDLLFKYVLDGESTGGYAGKVLVNNGSQQTMSTQTNANICVSPSAHAYTQPMLEIYADDVKCSHGSTVGKLDETALFYMQQRGIPEDEARLLLQHAFINDVLQRVAVEPLRDRLSHLVDLRFRGQLSKCRDCSMCR